MNVFAVIGLAHQLVPGLPAIDLLKFLAALWAYLVGWEAKGT